MVDLDKIQWDTDQSVVIKQVLAIAVYENTRGEIVIRQQDYMDEGDHIVVIHKQHIELLIRALRESLAEIPHA